MTYQGDQSIQSVFISFFNIQHSPKNNAANVKNNKTKTTSILVA